MIGRATDLMNCFTYIPIYFPYIYICICTIYDTHIYTVHVYHHVKCITIHDNPQNSKPFL